jgi:hypothetical protein
MRAAYANFIPISLVLFVPAASNTLSRDTPRRTGLRGLKGFSDVASMW